MTVLPRAAYTEPDWQRREQQELFAWEWVFAGTMEDFKAPGDFVSVRAGAFPLAAVMGKDGTLSGIHNVCRHRGAILLEGTRGSAGAAMVCPYHKWTYGLDGALRGAPNRAECFPDLEQASLGLKPAGVGVFRGMVFLNPDPTADFEAWIDPIRESGWPHDLSSPELKEAATLFYDLKCDWKVFVENALDGYHLAYLHKDTLGGPVPSENVWERYGKHMVWYATDDGEARHRMPGKLRDEARGMTPLAHTEGVESGGVYFLFPSTLIVPSPYDISVSTLSAAGPGRSRLTVRQWVGPWQSKDDRKYIAGYDPSSGIISSDHWKKYPLETGDFQTEDVWICERVQAGLESPAFEPGPLALGAGAEDPVGWFRKSIQECIGIGNA